MSTTAVTTDPPLRPIQAALGQLGKHCASCPTCMTMTETGENANLPCSTADQLYEAWLQARRSTPLFATSGSARTAKLRA
ncbi:hypothetical protein [Streptomyces bullii]|uniref:Uncharacterized protein n=1 Tax=Streptomyces bullii TaxID=349910 RepID=A0ABW0UKE7_9ACTN